MQLLSQHFRDPALVDAKLSGNDVVKFTSPFHQPHSDSLIEGKACSARKGSSTTIRCAGTAAPGWRRTARWREQAHAHVGEHHLRAISLEAQPNGVIEQRERQPGEEHLGREPLAEIEGGGAANGRPAVVQRDGLDAGLDGQQGEGKPLSTPAPQQRPCAPKHQPRHCSLSSTSSRSKSRTTSVPAWRSSASPSIPLMIPFSSHQFVKLRVSASYS